MSRFVQWCIDAKLLRAVALLWAMALISWTVVRTFLHLSLITASVTSALVAVVGILSVVIGMYTHSRNRD
ncbi:MAG TPA: hypothetical protein VFL54_04545 [Gammaproteobacteria bacterium]|nr:hypothetical protein [Gammaproteobacteria bacterium]